MTWGSLGSCPRWPVDSWRQTRKIVFPCVGLINVEVQLGYYLLNIELYHLHRGRGKKQ